MLVLEDFPFFTRVLRERIVVALGATLGLLRRPRQYCRCRRPTQHCPASPHPHPAGRGDWPGTVHPTASHHRVGDEIGRLAHEFDRMCLRLDAAYRTLEAENEAKLRLERDLRQSEQLATLGKVASRLAHEIGTP